MKETPYRHQLSEGMIIQKQNNNYADPHEMPVLAEREDVSKATGGLLSAFEEH